MLLTTHRLLVLEGGTPAVKRTIKLNNVMAMTKNMTKGKFNFAVHVRDEHDISFYSRERDELFKHIKECYFSLVNTNLPIYGVAQEVEIYLTTKRHIKEGRRAALPAEGKYRLKEEDVYEIREVR